MFFPHIFDIFRAVFLHIDYIYLQVIGLYFIFFVTVRKLPKWVCLYLACSSFQIKYAETVLEIIPLWYHKVHWYLSQAR